MVAKAMNGDKALCLDNYSMAFFQAACDVRHCEGLS